MATPQAIPTTWKGVQFRSRMEARWAVFFDALGLEWHFEPEGFSIDGTWYLPDFWLPQQKLWIECKPTPKFSEADERKIELFAHGPGHSAGDIASESDWALPWDGKQFVVLVGPPGDREISGHGGDDGHFLYHPGWDNYYHWLACPTCRDVGMVFEHRGGRLSCKHLPEKDHGDTDRIADAARGAIGERFDGQKTPGAAVHTLLDRDAERVLSYVHKHGRVDDSRAMLRHLNMPYRRAVDAVNLLIERGDLRRE